MNDIVLFAGLVGDSDITVTDSLIVAAIGIGVVFLGLVIIVALLYLFSLIFKVDLLGKIGSLFKRKKKVVEDNASAAVTEKSADEELVAVITAAISASMENETGVVAPFVIKSLKRK